MDIRVIQARLKKLDELYKVIAHRQLKVPDDERSLFATLVEAGILSRERAIFRAVTHTFK